MVVTSENAALSAVIGAIYDTARDPALWRRALEQCCSFVGGFSAVLYRVDMATEKSAALHLFNDDPHYTRLYAEKYMHMNPVFPAGTFVDPGVIYTPTDVVPEAEFIGTRFHKEWVAPQGIVDVVCVNLEKSATSSSVLSIRRDGTQGIADDAAKSRTALLIPHLQRAVSIGRLFDQSKVATAVLTETLGNVEAAIILVGVNGVIVFANEPARVMLDDAALLRESRGVLVAAAPDSQRMLRDIFIVAENGDMPVDGEGVTIPLSTSLRHRWFAHVLPLTSGDRQRTGQLYSATVAVFVSRISLASPPPLAMLAGRYQLTASEVRVLDAIMKVSSVKSVAELLGLSQATVKTHLHNLFRKTGTNRQSDLVKLMAGVEPSGVGEHAV
jgi:DNA-binding CsgD family transcriptional regulator